MSEYKVKAPLVQLRQKDGSNVHLYAGTPVGADADPEHVKLLVEAGMLEKVKPAPATKDDTSTTDSGKEPSVKDVLAEVGDDKEKAAQALEAEEAKGDKARSSLVEKLQAITTPEA